MFANALVGVDFRQGGRDAAALARQLLDRDGSMALAHVCASSFVPSRAAGLTGEDRERAEEQLEHEGAAVEVDAEPIVTQGPTPGQALHELAEERGADVLVLGSCHRGVLGRAMLGDHTRASIDGAPCAVAIAPSGYADRPKPIATIGVAYNSSPESKIALDTARKLAASSRAQIRALHIVTLTGFQYAAIGALVATEINDRVAQAESEMKALDGVHCHAQYGVPGQDLAAFGEEVDLLIVGSRGYGPWGRLVHGSISSELARHTRGPLLIVPRPAAPGGDGESAESADLAVPA